MTKDEQDAVATEVRMARSRLGRVVLYAKADVPVPVSDKHIRMIRIADLRTILDALSRARTFDEGDVERVARAIARATLGAGDPAIPETVLEEMVENVAVKFYPEARAALAALQSKDGE